MDKLIELITPLITPLVGLSGLILGIANIVSSRRERAAKALLDHAGAAEKLSNAAASVSNIQEKVIEELRDQLHACSERIGTVEADYAKRTARLEKTVSDLRALIADYRKNQEEQGRIIRDQGERINILEREKAALQKERDQLIDALSRKENP